MGATVAGAAGTEEVPRLPDYAELVLDLIDRIPRGRVASYGDVAELVGQGGPRQVGAVMSRYGSLTCWWRVVRADGRPPVCHERTALEHYRTERTPLRGDRVDMGRARWDGQED